LKINVNKLI